MMFAVTTSFAMLSLSACGDDDDAPDGGMTNAGRAAVAVDLGLPSGTKWADRNVGASSKTDVGEYFAWGEIATKSDFSWDTYKYGKASDELTKYCTDSEYGKDGFTDNKSELDLNDDVAKKQWGGKWRMPSKEQIEELFANTTNQWTTVDRVKGRLFTATNGNSIFLPAAGDREGDSPATVGSYGIYWSRTLCSDTPCYAYYLDFYSQNAGYDFVGRRYGHSVRPVLLNN